MRKTEHCLVLCHETCRDERRKRIGFSCCIIFSKGCIDCPSWAFGRIENTGIEAIGEWVWVLVLSLSLLNTQIFSGLAMISFYLFLLLLVGLFGFFSVLFCCCYNACINKKNVGRVQWRNQFWRTMESPQLGPARCRWPHQLAAGAAR